MYNVEICAAAIQVFRADGAKKRRDCAIAAQRTVQYGNLCGGFSRFPTCGADGFANRPAAAFGRVNGGVPAPNYRERMLSQCEGDGHQNGFRIGFRFFRDHVFDRLCTRYRRFCFCCRSNASDLEQKQPLPAADRAGSGRGEADGGVAPPSYERRT